MRILASGNVATRGIGIVRWASAVLLIAGPGLAQIPSKLVDAFPRPIPATEGAITVKFVEFASIPSLPGEDLAPRMMLLVDVPGVRRLFVNDMRGPLYGVSYDGKSVAPYLDINATQWGVHVQSEGRERGFQSFAFHPQFNQRGALGFGKFYTITDTSNLTPTVDFKPGGGNHTHDSVLLEWTAKDPTATSYDGGPPREVIRWEQPFANHNCGHLTFNPLATPGSADYGLLYVGFADGGSAGDPFKHAQNLNVGFGKILRIDPLGSNSANGKYGIPAANPFAKKAGALGEVYAYGLRNPQRLFWDRKNGNMFVSNIGQNTVEGISQVTPGANFGWNVWEASFHFGEGTIALDHPRGDPAVTFPLVEYDHTDPLLQSRSAIIGGVVYRRNTIKQLSNLLLFGDNPSGEIFYVSADRLPKGGQDQIRRVLLSENGASRTLLQLIKEKNMAQGKPPAARADLRFSEATDGRIFLLNKGDGTIRLLVPDAQK